MFALCLKTGLMSVILGSEITLSWQHSVEKIVWQEDYKVDQQSIVLIEARVRGTGAGMEIPEGAVYVNDKTSKQFGAWQYQPKNHRFESINLTHSTYTSPYQICQQHVCQTLPQLMPSIADNAVVELTACSLD